MFVAPLPQTLSGVMLTCSPIITRKRSRISGPELSISLGKRAMRSVFFDLIDIKSSPEIDKILCCLNVFEVKRLGTAKAGMFSRICIEAEFCQSHTKQPCHVFSHAMTKPIFRHNTGIRFLHPMH
jgi:hypothetical protein